MSTEPFLFESEDPESARAAPAEKNGATATERQAPNGEAEAQPPEIADGTWEGYLPRLRSRYPGARDGTLFCVYKLEGDPELSMRDFRAEAELRGVPLSGRSLHAAKVLLGMEPPPKPRRKAADLVDESESRLRPARTTRGAGAAVLDDALGDLGADLESALRRAVEEATRAETERLRDAMRQAIDVLRDALGDAD